VWLARNVMGTFRAVKIVWRRNFESDRPYEREFAGIQRYEPVSRSADGLVHVLHVGRNDADGCFYYVMELADSTVPMADELSESGEGAGTEGTPSSSYAPRTLRSDMKRSGRLPVGDCLRLALDVVGGLVRLHERGLVHRDVKPGNIIFIEGRAKLADVGLVSRESEGRTFVGTEGYIPPEGPGSPGADLYALGMVLYEATTGYPPDHFPKVPPEWFAEDAGPESLEFHAVVLKACEGARERRYQSGEELQADLALLQSGQSVRHLRALEERVNRWRRAGWLAAAIVVIAVTTALVAHWRATVAAESRAKEVKLLEQAQRSLARAENAEHQSRTQLYTALLEQARATVRSGEMGQRVRALDAIRRAAAISNSVALRREVVAALSLPDLRLERELSFDAGFSAKQLDPTFERIAVSRPRGPVEIRTVADDRLLATLPASTNLICFGILWSPDGRYLAIHRDYDEMGYRSDVEVWAWTPAPRRVLLIREARWKARAFHPTRPEFLIGRSKGLITTWDLETGMELAHRTFAATARDLAYSPDGNRVVSTYQRTGGWGISVHQAADGTILCSNVLAARINAVAWHPDGESIAMADDSGLIQLMDARAGGLRILGRHSAVAVTTTFHADGRYLITGAWGRELICWDLVRWQRAFNIDLDSYIAQFRSDGRACATVTGASVQLHSFDSPNFERELPDELAPRVRHLVFSQDGRWLAGSGEEQLGVWEVTGHGGGAFSNDAGDSRPYWSAAGELFASRSGVNGCFRWRVVAPARPGAPPVLERLPLAKLDGFYSLSVLSNQLAWTSDRGSRITDAAGAAFEPDHWRPTVPGINGLSADGRWLAIYGAYTRHLTVYRLPELQEVARLQSLARISGFSFTPSGEELAVTSNGQVEFWSTATWEHTRIATNFTGLPGVGLICQGDGRALWLARNLRLAGLFDARSFEPWLLLPSGVLPLALSPDGDRLAVSKEGRRVQIWSLSALRRELAGLGLDW
jgi:WD40 repeat protein